MPINTHCDLVRYHPKNKLEMKILFKYLRLLSLSTSGALLLCIVFAANPEIAEGTITGKVFWFHFTILLLAFSVLFMEITIRKSSFTFSLPDGLLLLLTGLVLFTYNREVDPQPERLLFACQLSTLWFMLRAILQNHPELRSFFLAIIMCTGIFEAIWGMGHLYGNPSVHHPLFNENGPIFNAAPFSGYLVIILPICLNQMLRFGNCDKIAWWETRTMLFYLATAGTILIVIALPGGMSRSAWLAAIVSCCWVIFLRKSSWQLMKQRVIKHSKLVVVGCTLLFLLIAGLPILDSMMGSEKSAGRMLMWNMTTKAILSQPVMGTGLGGFPLAYAKAQADYFASGMASVSERTAACCPKFAFNEFLQIGLELGIAGLLLFALWIGFSFYYGLKNKQLGATGSILALLFLAMYAYPLQLPSFWVLLIFFSAICVTRPAKTQKTAGKSLPYIGALAAVAACVLFFGQRNYYLYYKEWKTVQLLEEKKEHRVAAQGYLSLYPRLSHRVEFLREGAKCLESNSNYADAIIWTRRALQITADPEFYDILAESLQQLGLYKQAENCLQQCLHILPERIDTYYRLTKLYSKQAFYQPEKLKLAAYSVLRHYPSVLSDEIRFMREDVSRLLETETGNETTVSK